MYSLQAAMLLQQQGRLAEADALYGQILAAEPARAEAWHWRGLTAYQAGRHADAVQMLAEAIALDGRNALAFKHLGIAQAALGDNLAAEASFTSALAWNDLDAAAHFHLGALLAARDEKPAAVNHYRRAAELDPRRGEAHFRLGSLLQELHDLAGAEAALRAAIELQPGLAEAQNNLGCVYRDLNQNERAEKCFRAAVAGQPDSPRMLLNLANLLLEREQCQEAAGLAREVLRLEPTQTEALVTLGVAYQKTGRVDEAIVVLRQAISQQADLAAAHYALGLALQQQGETESAIASFDEAIRLNPNLVEAYCNRAFARLLLGHYPEGWRDHAWRLQSPRFQARNFEEPLWDGSPLAGRTLLVYADAALGDTLQFARYVKLAEALNGLVVFEAQAPLVPLLKASGLRYVLAAGTPLPPFDVQIPLLNLPQVWGTTLENVPADVPYLATDPARVAHWQHALAGYEGLRIGIVWQGNPAYYADAMRSVPLSKFEPLAHVPGVRLISLQKNAGREQLAQVSQCFAMIDLGESLDREAAFVDTAAVIENLDLVIASDTAVAHLAVALGAPVWLALSTPPNWRWLLNRGDSPWYPSMRLFRQPKPGDWASVFQHMAEELREGSGVRGRGSG